MKERKDRIGRAVSKMKQTGIHKRREMWREKGKL